MSKRPQRIGVFKGFTGRWRYSESKAAMTDAKHILLVLEGDSAVRDSLKFSIEVEGFEVRAYASPDELLNDNSLPASSCLIIHYHLPTMNGLDVIAKLRERRNFMPALLMTGRPNANIRNRASAAGIAIFEKPIQGTELIDFIHKLLNQIHGLPTSV